MANARGLKISNAHPEDLPEILALLAQAGLGDAGVADHIHEFLLGRAGGRLVAVTGLEDLGSTGILRSVAVAPDRRGQGHAAAAISTIIERSRARGHEALYLLTRTAEAYFERFGFRAVDRGQVRPSALRSPQFYEKPCELSTVMVLEFAADAEAAGTTAAQEGTKHEGERQGRKQVEPEERGMSEETIRQVVRERYAQAARSGACCGAEETQDAGAKASCCGPQPIASTGRRAGEDTIPSLGCGFPIEAAALSTGETVVDLGSGPGLDAFMAAVHVGPSGHVIGVDMTPEMVARARAHAARIGASNVEFRLGEIEHLPVADSSADVVVSNCVINLLPDKRPAFAEACRVLRPGGRLVVSDIVSTGPVPAELMTPDRWAACIAGAVVESEYLGMIEQAGFADVEVLTKRGYSEAGLFSVTVRAVKR